MRKAAVVLILVALASGCIGQAADGPGTAKEPCIELCKTALSEGADLSAGPCLSESVAEGWVCDVAHSPRTSVDNDPANQCAEYGRSASHFVEVDETCNLIREK